MPPASTAPAPARAPSREDAPATGAEALLRALAEGGVEVAFANPGTTEMWLVGALDKIPAIRPILGLHETVCAGAADGYARVARKPACTVRAQRSIFVRPTSSSVLAATDTTRPGKKEN